MTDLPATRHPSEPDPVDPTDPVAVAVALIRCPSVTPHEGGALACLQGLLEPLGFDVERPVFHEDGTPDVENLFAVAGPPDGRHLAFAGHTDVVPPGPPEAWSSDPFGAAVREETLYGRGAVDMKGGIAAFVAAYARHVRADGPAAGRVSLVITGDEEGPSLNGTVKLLDWMAERGHRPDACLVGEPTNRQTLGDMAKIGRRGSLSATVTVNGTQGHVAYPHLADNPLRAVAAIAEALYAEPLDKGTDRFPATNLEITSIDTGNEAVNVIPASASLSFNVRFGDLWTPGRLQAELDERIRRACAADGRFRAGRERARVEIAWRPRPSESFLTRDDRLSSALSDAIMAVTGATPELSTTGGTSDARFIKNICPVVEFGLVGKTMHMADERVPLSDLERLTAIYEAFIANWFAAAD